MEMNAGTINELNATALVEEGTAAMRLSELSSRQKASRREVLDVIVIGAGQAGLSVGYHLARAGLRFTILDANERVGDSWRQRWDSLRLFTSARLDSLDGKPFPAAGDYFPTKDEMADYLEDYAAHFQLPVQTGVKVERLFKRGGHYVVKAGDREVEALQIVVAMAGYQEPRLPAFASGLSTDIVQMHSKAYRNPGQLKPGGVLLVGAGNSGADIAMETARNGHDTWIAGPSTGSIPFRTERFLGRMVLQPLLLRLVFHRLLTIKTPIGRKVRPIIQSKGAPLIRVKPKDLAAAGVRRVSRVIGVQDGQPLLEDGKTLFVSNVIWCSGFQPGFEWIDLPVFGKAGELLHRGGIAEKQPGLYFVGLTFLYAMSSSMIHGVGRDAARIVKTISASLGTSSNTTDAFAVAPAGRSR